MLPNDVARCPGYGNDDDGWRDGCDDCARRTAPPVDGVTPWMQPPAIIVIECEFRIG